MLAFHEVVAMVLGQAYTRLWFLSAHLHLLSLVTFLFCSIGQH